MSITISGVVEAKGRDNKRIRVQGKWYSSYKESSLNGAESGDTVEFDYVEKGEWLNIRGDVRIISKKSGSATPEVQSMKVGNVSLDRERSIARQNALTNARELFIAARIIPSLEVDLDAAVADIINVAYAFEAYTTGDLEKQKALNELSSK